MADYRSAVRWHNDQSKPDRTYVLSESSRFWLITVYTREIEGDSWPTPELHPENSRRRRNCIGGLRMRLFTALLKHKFHEIA